MSNSASSGLQSHHGKETVIVTTVLGFVAIFSVFLRILSRRMRNLSLALDDYLVVASMVLVIVGSVLSITLITHGGVGNHITNITPGSLKYTLRTLIPCEIIYGLSLSLTKTSFLVLYLRLFGSRRSLRLSIWIALTIIWAWALSVILESFLLCGSFRYNWDPLDFESGGEEERRECVDRNAACVASGVVNIVTDVMVMVMPIPHILVLQLRVGRKVGLVCVFSVGLVLSIIGITRTIFILDINDSDLTYTLTPAIMWSNIEEQLAIIVANLPLLRNILSKILPDGWFGSRRRENNSSNNNRDHNNYNDSTEQCRQISVWPGYPSNNNSNNNSPSPKQGQYAVYPFPWTDLGVSKSGVVFLGERSVRYSTDGFDSRRGSDAELARGSCFSAGSGSGSGIRSLSELEPAHLV